MTRINSNLHPKLLCDSMLLAEHREIVRIPRTIKSGKAKAKDIPKTFRLGSGHVKFNYNKLKYLHKRFLDLREECLNRGFNISDYRNSFRDLPTHLYNDWKPTRESLELIVERISERLDNMKDKDIRYYGEKINKEHLKTIMREQINS